MTDQLYERSNEARLTRLLMESNQNTHTAVNRAIDLLAGREREMARLSRECEQASDKILEQRAEIERLRLYERAIKSMAAQYVHPKMTAEELARMQLGEQ